MQTQRTNFGHSRGRRGWDESRVSLKHIHHHMQNRQLMACCCVMQGEQPDLHDNPEGRDGVGGGREVHEGKDKCMPMADSC